MIFQPQPVITKDNVTMQIDSVVYFQITDPKLYTSGVENPLNAIENLTATTLRNLIGEIELDSTLTSRNTINTKMRVILDEATDSWRIKINRVELKNIIPPAEIQDAMEKQMKAERERRESILKTEGEKEAAILRIEAKKKVAIKEAEGKTKAILNIQRANTEAIKLIKETALDKTVLTLKGMEAFEKIANGQATKIIIPSELRNIITLSELFHEAKK